MDPAASLPPTPATPPSRPWLYLAGAALAVVVLTWGGAQALRTQARLHEQLAQQGAALRAAEAQAAKVRADLDQLAAEFESRSANAAALDTLVADLTRGRDELALLEVERLLTLASQELQFGADVPGAVAALQAADARLARNDAPRLAPLRRALARDLERLRATPAVDFNGIALKLDQLARAAADWPLLAQVEPAPARASAPRKAAPPPAPAGAWAWLRDWLATEFGDLVRIQRVETPEALQLSATQQELLRQQFALRLLGARLALDARNDRRWRADLAEAQALLARYFDGKAAPVAAASAQLKQIAAIPLQLSLPQLNESFSALRALRPIALR